jgi:hypothetical protein
MTMPRQQKQQSAVYDSDKLPHNVTTRLQDAKELAVNSLLRPNFYGNVVGVGIGRKIIDGDVTETRCIRVYVQSKRDLDDLSPAVVVPSNFLDIPTDIIEVGRLGRAGNRKEPRDDKSEDGIGPGSSIRLKTHSANVNQGAGGTLGAIVKVGNKSHILSCNHILAVNGRVHQADVVTPALSLPNKSKKIAESSESFVKLVRDQNNLVDCAIAPLTEKDVDRKLRSGELDPRLGSPDRGQRVRKDGAMTGITSGTIVDLNADFYIEYSFGTFLLTDQLVIEGDDDNFAADGDSGSIVTCEEGEKTKALGLIFAEAGKFAIACPLTRVFAELEKRLGSHPQKIELEVR